MAVKEYVVIGGGLVARVGQNGKKAQRFNHGAKVKLDDRWNNVDRLEGLAAIAPADAEGIKPSSTWDQAVAANRYHQEQMGELVDFGAIAQAEDADIQRRLLEAGGSDDGGQGSSPTPVPGEPGYVEPPELTKVQVPPGGDAGKQQS